MDHADLLEQARRQANEARAIEHLIDSPEFKLVYAKSEELARRRAEQLLTSRDLVGIRQWVERERLVQGSYGDMTVAALRKLASTRRIFNYQYLIKQDLVLALERDDERLARLRTH